MKLIGLMGGWDILVFGTRTVVPASVIQKATRFVAFLIQPITEDRKIIVKRNRLLWDETLWQKIDVRQGYA